MSVLECDRSGCDSIMCTRFSYQLQQYICDECFKELCKKGVQTDVEEFMKSKKKSYSPPKIDAEQYFGQIFEINR